MRIAVLALDGVFDTGLAAVLDSLAAANELAKTTGVPTPEFEVSVVGVRPEVRTALGFQIPAQETAATAAPDWLVVPALNCKTAEQLVAALGREDVLKALDYMRTCHEAGARVAAACTSTFVLAESGLLDGRDATTTWWLRREFQRRYPAIRLDPERFVVASGRVVTSGAAFSHLDLALWLIRNRRPELAGLVANYFVFASRPSQSTLMISDHLSNADPLIERFDRWVRERLDTPITLDAVADELAISKRTLSRRMNEALGKTPLEYVLDLRIERAVHLLRTSKCSVDQIAEQVGYADGVTLRTLLRRRLGRSVRELRAG